VIPYDQEFLIATLPTTPKGTALVAVGRGVKINHIYYWSDRFREPGIEKHSVPVRFDPFDLGTAYAYVRNQWVACWSEHLGAFQGRSEKEVMIASREILKRRQEHSRKGGITARRLADFLISIESEEVLLQQRLRDRESAAVRNGIEPAGPAVGQDPIQQDHVRGDTDPIELSAVADLELYGEF
jgi:putative transposase